MKYLILTVILTITGVLAFDRAEMEKVRQCMLGSDAFDCCEFPRVISEDTMKNCFEQMKMEDKKAGRHHPGPPGGMCLFKCFVESAGFMDGDRINEGKVLQNLETASYGKSNAADWINVVRQAVPRAFSDYSVMMAKMNGSQTHNETDKDCCPSNGYFLSRLNAELYVNCPNFSDRSPKCNNYRDKVRNCTVFIAKPNRADGPSQRQRNLVRQFTQPEDNSASNSTSAESNSSEDGSSIGSVAGGLAAGAGGAAIANALNNNRQAGHASGRVGDGNVHSAGGAPNGAARANAATSSGGAHVGVRSGNQANNQASRGKANQAAGKKANGAQKQAAGAQRQGSGAQKSANKPANANAAGRANANQVKSTKGNLIAV